MDIVEMLVTVGIGGVAGLVWFISIVWFTRNSYRDGVWDGFGYAFQPNSPNTQEAKKVIQESELGRSVERVYRANGEDRITEIEALRGFAKALEESK